MGRLSFVIDDAAVSIIFFIKGEMAHSPYLDDSGRFDLSGAGPGIGVEPPFPRQVGVCVEEVL